MNERESMWKVCLLERGGESKELKPGQGRWSGWCALEVRPPGFESGFSHLTSPVTLGAQSYSLRLFTHNEIMTAPIPLGWCAEQDDACKILSQDLA